MTCPRCHLENPPSALYCDYGHEFVRGTRPSTSTYGAEWSTVERSGSRPPLWLVLGCGGLLATLTMLLITALLLAATWKTVTESKRGDRGFQVEVPRGMRSGFRIALRGGEAPAAQWLLDWDSVEAERWLCGDRALLLHFNGRRAVDSMVEKVPLALLYDYERRVLYAVPREGEVAARAAELERSCATPALR